LRAQGLLLVQDRSLPSVVTLVLGETLSTSWWSHPRGREVFRCLDLLADHPDVLTTKLVLGKVTFVHRNLWPALLAVATAREPWQFRRLSKPARTLYERVQRVGETTASGTPAKALERRLLVHSEQAHTETGHHETRLESWEHWLARTGYQLDAGRLTAAQGREQLEAAARRIGGSGSELPWE
jgi:hypothetical protein